MAVRAHLPLCLRKQRVGDTLAAMCRRDVDLLRLVADDHDEAGDLPVDDGHGRVAHALGRPRAERLVGADADELVRNVLEMAVAPAATPDLGDRGGVAGLGRPDHSPCLRKTTQALWPPKPNEFETPTWMSDLRASFGM